MDRNTYVKELIDRMDKSREVRNKMFKSIYGGITGEMHEDWKAETYKGKEKFLKKHLRDEDFYKVMTVLKESKGNMFKAYKMLKQIKKDETEERLG